MSSNYPINKSMSRKGYLFKNTLELVLLENKKNYQLELTQTKLLGKNSLINILVKIIPMGVGVIAVPIIIRSLGKDSFGIIALIWMVVNYLTMFDLGMSPAMVKSYGKRLGADDMHKIHKVLWTGINLLTLIGLVVGLIFSLSVNYLVVNIFKIDPHLLNEAKTSFYYTGIIIPFIISSASFRSILQTQQRFDIISIIQGVNSLFNYLLPILLVKFTNSGLSTIVLSLLFLKVLIFFLYLIFSFKVEHSIKKFALFDLGVLKEMISFGKWMTVTNIIGPLIGQVDRYFIGSALSVSAITFYTTPLEVLSKVMIIPVSLVSVLFPAFSTLSENSKENANKLFLNSLKTLGIILFPLMFTLAVLAPWGLKLWVGQEFVEKSTFIAQVFSLVFFLRGFGVISASYLHGMSRPDLTAKFHIFEITGLLSVFAILRHFDLVSNGTIAICILIVTFIDTVLLLTACFFLQTKKLKFLKELSLILLFGLIFIGSQFFIEYKNNTNILLIFGLVIYSIVFFNDLKRLFKKAKSFF